MNERQLIEIGREVMHKTYCNGITMNYENITVESDDSISIPLDFQIPKRVREETIEHLFFIRLRNVGLINLSNDGKIIAKSSREEFVKESIERYKEFLQQRERFIIKLFAGLLIKIPQIHVSLTPIRKVLHSFKQEDYRTDNLNRNFDEKEIKYINFLKDFGYLRKEGEKLTLDNNYIKKLLDPEIEKKTREEQIEAIMASVFATNFQYITTELQNTAIVPYIGILTTFCTLLLEINNNIRLSVSELFSLYKEHYASGQDERDFEDKIFDMKKSDILKYDESKKMVILPTQLFTNLIQNFKIEFRQQQLA